ncbi:TPA: preprotein translocase subunit YajC [Streptococcus pyogenes]|uniref:preprotein translocase subunit YajC n=1 Tax=Streptococcus pyogenes TaxID=1314 RepID=UPI00109BDF41|nr:preprotein translocase subunit YajC [Streptococcus pyogenes]MBA5748552.1 preprotein translocase subunit YajC [Streptococcus pyogenes serotype M12]VGR68795.1 preprotein translocase subunit YajC [Streptococcus pyogenes]VGR69933.1 preprotein translocase subunit YajC [Streptococcus pyogenes]VHE31280.1 preprotein translocase subunit YajC [Streptococcus pyogenes]VHE31923.1 preprotein translocase subunit YajC [Streptococcus pyogenes]
MGFPTILMFVVMLGLIWFMQRQQKKQAQERQNQLNAIEKGDEVVTIGGMFAIVDEVDTTAKKIVLDVDSVFLTFELSAIKRIVTKATTETTLVETEETSVVNEPAVETVDSTDTDSAIESH